MTKMALIWIGGTLEISALIALVAALFVDPPAAEQVLGTLAVILAFNGISLQLLATEFKKAT
jgi:hypothetical protein